MRLLITLLFTLILSSISYSKNLTVPSAIHPTIQSDISDTKVVAKDCVVVLPGTYFENLNFMGKAIKVKSRSGPEATVIDGGQLSSVVLFDSGEDRNSVLKGFTITNGTGSLDPYQWALCGGGIHCIFSSPMIVNNIITQNFVSNFGAFGGGICLWGSNAVIFHNRVEFNRSYDDDGAGIACWDGSDAIIANNIIWGNSAGLCAGGIDCARSSPTIYNNLIADNLAGLNGNSMGGGIRCVGDNLGSADPVITNCTICWNSASWSGGGISTYNNASPTVINSIIWDNTAPLGPQIDSQANPGTTFTISYSDVQGGQAMIYDIPGVVVYGPGNINAPPLFVGPSGGAYYELFYLDQAASPCVNAGKPLSPLVNGTTSLSGAKDNGTVDMGFHYVRGMPLIASLGMVSWKGGVVDYFLDAGPSNAGRTYLLLATVSGTSPGIPLPGGYATLPLNWDMLTDLVLIYLNTPMFANFTGTLDTLGQSMAQLDAPPTALVGPVMHFAYTMNMPFDFASNAVSVQFVQP